MGMSVSVRNAAKSSRWLDWKPRAQILPESAESETTKPSKLGCVGFEGLFPVESAEMRGKPAAEQQDLTSSVNDAQGQPWAEWKAAELNRLFREQGATGEAGCITGATVRHGTITERGRV